MNLGVVGNVLRAVTVRLQMENYTREEKWTRGDELEICIFFCPEKICGERGIQYSPSSSFICYENGISFC